MTGTEDPTHTGATAKSKAGTQKDEKLGAIKEKVGNALHIDKMAAKGAAQREEARSAYPREQAEGEAAGVKDKVVGATKAAAGGVTHNENLRQAGHEQEQHGDKRQQINA